MRFSVTRLQLALTRGVLQQSGASFAAVQLNDGWSAIACLGSLPEIEPAPTAPLSRTFWTQALEALNQQMEQPSAGALLKSSPSRRVVQSHITLPDARVLKVICKDGQPVTWYQRVSGRYAGPKEWREFWTGQRLLQLGLPTPRPLACLWTRAGIVGIRCRLVTRYLGGALPIDRMVRKLLAARPSDRDANRRAVNDLAVAVGNLLKTLSTEDLYHRDLKASNLLVGESEGRLHPWLIDLDGLAHERRGGHVGLRRSVARLAIALQDATELPATVGVRVLRQFAGRHGWRREWQLLREEIGRLTASQRRRRRDRSALYE